jgi:hypothetical protein
LKQLLRQVLLYVSATWIACSGGALSAGHAVHRFEANAAGPLPFTPAALEAHYGTWELPQMDPCEVLSDSDVESAIGTLLEMSRPGGSALDGPSCRYLAVRPLIANIGIISTAAFESGKSEPDKAAVLGPFDDAYIVSLNSFETALFARRGRFSVMIRISAPKEMSRQLRASVSENLAHRALLSLERHFLKL